MHGGGRRRRAAVRLVEVDLGRPNIGIGPEKFDPGGTSAGHAGTNEVRAVGLTGNIAKAGPASDPLVVKRRILRCKYVEHSAANSHVRLVKLSTRVTAGLTFVGSPL